MLVYISIWISLLFWKPEVNPYSYLCSKQNFCAHLHFIFSCEYGRKCIVKIFLHFLSYSHKNIKCKYAQKFFLNINMNRSLLQVSKTIKKLIYWCKLTMLLYFENYKNSYLFNVKFNMVEIAILNFDNYSRIAHSWFLRAIWIDSGNNSTIEKCIKKAVAFLVTWSTFPWGVGTHGLKRDQPLNINKFKLCEIQNILEIKIRFIFVFSMKMDLEL